ncbi:MAG TPA: hypothetical protein VFQ81_02650 [Candidatus Limnocylindria bacterium]|nr:hypothetical protein [Candidatus Limnocylindria bacterium]
MSGRQRCARSAGIAEAVLAGEPLTAADSTHLAGCPACTRLAARVPSLESGIARAALALSIEGPIPAGVLDTGVVEAPIERPGAGSGLRVASLATVAAVAVAVTVIGLGMLRPPSVSPAPGVVDPVAEAARVVALLEAGGLTCADATLNKRLTPPLVGESCRAPAVTGVNRSAVIYTTATGETWVEGKVMVADRTNDAQVRPATDFLLDVAAAGIPESGQSITVRGYLGGWLDDRSRPRDQWVILGDRLIELEGSWAQGFVLRIGPP